MRYLAQETTIHGVKDLYNAGAAGRLMWILVFVISICSMVLQLRGIISNYANEDVGTRVSLSSKEEFLAAPSFYYCNKHWLPSGDTFKKFMDCAYPYDNLTQDFTSVTEEILYQKCYPDYWRYRLKEEVINSVIDRGARQTEDKYDLVFAPWGLKPNDTQIMVRGFMGLYLAFYDLERELVLGYGGSLMNYLGKLTTISENGRTFPASGVLTKFVDYFEKWVEDLEGTENAINETFSTLPEALRFTDGVPLVTNQGLCWEVRDGPPIVTRWDAVDKVVRHLVLHFGGYGYGLEHFTKRWGAAAAPDGSNYVSRPVPFQKPPFQPGHFSFSTRVFIHIQGHYHLAAENGIELTSSRPTVFVHFWTRKITSLNRRSHPCRVEWDLLDQEHCRSSAITFRSESSTTSICTPYLPASAHYPERKISNTSCRLGLYGLLLSTLKTAALNNTAKAGSITGKIDQAAIPVSALKWSVDKSVELECPPPCQDTSFQYQVSYTMNDERLLQRTKSDEVYNDWGRPG